MTTRLEGTLKREIDIASEPYTLTLTGEGFELVGKGRRKGLEISWEDLTSGEAALATALRASITGDVPLAPSEKNAAKRSSGKRTKRAR